MQVKMCIALSKSKPNLTDKIEITFNEILAESLLTHDLEALRHPFIGPFGEHHVLSEP